MTFKSLCIAGSDSQNIENSLKGGSNILTPGSLSRLDSGAPIFGSIELGTNHDLDK
jgi:hypothetical protein